MHSVIVGFVSCVPTMMLESEQKSSFPQWFLHCETVHLMLLFGFELQLIRVPSVFFAHRRALIEMVSAQHLLRIYILRCDPISYSRIILGNQTLISLNAITLISSFAMLRLFLSAVSMTSFAS